MSSYNQTTKIMEELKLKMKSASSTPNKKVFVVVLEGTESEFEEIRSLGGIEIEDTNILSRIPSISTNIERTSCLDNRKINNAYLSNKDTNHSICVSTGSVITEKDVAKRLGETKEIVLKDGGIITPLARDLAKKLGIKVVRAKS